jgi:hypothetical protein
MIFAHRYSAAVRDELLTQLRTKPGATWNSNNSPWGMCVNNRQNTTVCVFCMRSITVHASIAALSILNWLCVGQAVVYTVYLPGKFRLLGSPMLDAISTPDSRDYQLIVNDMAKFKPNFPPE